MIVCHVCGGVGSSGFCACGGGGGGVGSSGLCDGGGGGVGRSGRLCVNGEGGGSWLVYVFFFCRDAT